MFLVSISTVRKEARVASLMAMVRRTTRLKTFLHLCPLAAVCYLHLSRKAEAHLGLIFLIDPPQDLLLQRKGLRPVPAT